MQERDLKRFQENQKREMKMLKMEVDVLPSSTRKDALKQKREEKQVEQLEKVLSSSSRPALKCFDLNFRIVKLYSSSDKCFGLENGF